MQESRKKWLGYDADNARSTMHRKWRVSADRKVDRPNQDSNPFALDDSSKPRARFDHRMVAMVALSLMSAITSLTMLTEASHILALTMLMIAVACLLLATIQNINHAEPFRVLNSKPGMRRLVTASYVFIITIDILLAGYLLDYIIGLRLSDWISTWSAHSPHLLASVGNEGLLGLCLLGLTLTLVLQLAVLYGIPNQIHHSKNRTNYSCQSTSIPGLSNATTFAPNNLGDYQKVTQEEHAPKSKFTPSCPRNHTVTTGATFTVMAIGATLSLVMDAALALMLVTLLIGGGSVFLAKERTPRLGIATLWGLFGLANLGIGMLAADHLGNGKLFTTFDPASQDNPMLHGGIDEGWLLGLTSLMLLLALTITYLDHQAAGGKSWTDALIDTLPEGLREQIRDPDCLKPVQRAETSAMTVEPDIPTSVTV